MQQRGRENPATVSGSRQIPRRLIFIFYLGTGLAVLLLGGLNFGKGDVLGSRFARFAQRYKIQASSQSAPNTTISEPPRLTFKEQAAHVHIDLGHPLGQHAGNASGAHLGTIPPLARSGTAVPAESSPHQPHVSAGHLQSSTRAERLDGTRLSANASDANTDGSAVRHSCFEARPDKTCSPQLCSGQTGSDQTRFVGLLAANGTWYREERPQFDFGGQCAVSLKHRFVFVHVLKAGGSSLHEFFRRALCRPEGNKWQCADDVFRLRFCHAVVAEKELETFFWFSFVRHPFARAISAWRMALRPEFLHGQAVPFDRFAMDPTALQTQTRLMPMHWRPQNIFITTRGNCPVVDFIGKLERGGRFERDMKFVLERIGSQELLSQWKEHAFPHMNENEEVGDKSLAKSLIKGAVAVELYKRYEKDFAWFGFDRHDAEYGQEYNTTSPYVAGSVEVRGLPDSGRMDASVVASVTASMNTSCFSGSVDQCSQSPCDGAQTPKAYMGMLQAKNGVDRKQKPKFDFQGQCAVSVKHRFIFVHVPKAGGSSFHDFFRGATCSNVVGRKCDDVEAFQLMGCGPAVEKHGDFFKFAFVRHPFSRAISSWQMALLPGFLQGPRLPFNEWAIDPSKQQTRLMAMHWFSQHEFITTKGDCPVVDFVGLLAGGGRFERDLEYVLGKIGSETLWREWKTHGFPRENAESGDRGREETTKEAKGMIKGAVAEELYKRYEKDFALFGFDRHDTEYGQEYTLPTVGLRDHGRMDASVVASVTASMNTSCFSGSVDQCSQSPCDGTQSVQSYLGLLQAKSDIDRKRGPKFDFQGQCAVSVKHRFIFVHVPKAGGSSFHDFFRGAMCKRVEGRSCDDVEAFQLMGCGPAVEKHGDFFKFAFVRHPFSRAISSWQMAHWPGFLQGPRLPFNEWAMDPSKLKTKLMAMHWYSQNEFITTKGDCPVVDFVGLLAGGGRFERDLEYVLGKIGSETLWREWKTHGFPRENSGSEDRYKKELSKEAKGMIRGAVAEELYKRYEKDFALFGFDRHDGEFGHENTSAAVGLRDHGRMEWADVVKAVSGMTTSCYTLDRGQCHPVRCPIRPQPLHFVGSLSALGTANRLATTKAEFAGHCAVSKKLRFVFFHVPKAGGSSFHDFFHKALCQSWDRKTKTCDDPEAFRLMVCSEAVRDFPTFFRFSFVRHPFSRAVSAWQMALLPGFLQGPSLPFNEWAMDPSKLKTKLMAMHWEPQEHFIWNKGGCPVVDFVGLLAGGGRFERDLEYVLGKIGSETLWREWKMHGFPRENADVGDKSREKAKGLIKGAVAEELYKRYEKDFALFGFDRHDTEYGQEYTLPTVGLRDHGRMDASVVASVTASMNTSCFSGSVDQCSQSPCDGTQSVQSYLGLLQAKSDIDRKRGPKFDFQGQCAVSVKHRFIFVHVPRAGGSSFHDFFRKSMCKRVEGRSCDDVEAFQLMGCGPAVEKHGDFFKFAFVRHPFSRAISSWQMAHWPGFLQGPRLPFNEWAMDPSKLQTKLMAMHWYSQNEFITTKGDCPVVDFVGLLAGGGRFERDLEYVLGKIGSETLWREWKTHGFPRDKGGSKDKSREKEAKGLIKGAVAEELYKRYEKDFALFGFDRHDAEYGQEYKPDPVGLPDHGRMDASVVASVTASMNTSCFMGERPTLQCLRSPCSESGPPQPYLGKLQAKNAVDRKQSPKFDFQGQCAVSVKHRFIFVHVPKAGGSSFHDFFRGAMCKQIDGRSCDDVQAFQLKGCGPAVVEHGDFFKFAFVRHPFSRAVSSWQMAHWPGFLQGPRLPFNEWAMDPSKLKTKLMAMHWFSQHEFITTKGDCPVVDFVGLLAGGGRFERDLEYVLGKIGSETLWREWKTHGFPRENSGSEDRYKKELSKEAKGMIKGAVAEELYKRYEKDFALFGFDRHDTEYGQEYTLPTVGLPDHGRMDASVVASVTASMNTSCFSGVGDQCSASPCDAAQTPKAYMGMLQAKSDINRRQAPKFDFQGQCAVSVKHRFIFFHVTKVAGTSFHNFFRKTMCKKVEGRKCDDVEAFQLMGCGPALSKHGEFFKFAFVRHPFSRAVSSWQNAQWTNFVQGPRIPFNEWAMDPSKLKTKLMSMMWMPQHEFVTTKGDCPVVDFVGLLAGGGRFERDLEYVLGKIGSETLWREWKTHGFPQDNQGAKKKSREKEARGMIKGAVAEELYKRYEKDFALFGFDRHDAEYGHEIVM